MANAFISGRRYPYGTSIVPNANSSFYSFVANSATNAHLVDGKEISEWTAGTVWTCTYNNGVITLPEGKELSQGNIQPIQFIAPTASNSLTTLTINSQSYTIKMQDGSEVPENLWAANSVVFAVVSEDQKTINFKSGGGGISLDPLTNPAVAANILTGKEVYNDQGEKITGTMAEYSTAQTGGTPTTDGTNVTTPVTLSGYYTTESGLIVPKSTVLGVVLPTNTTATAADILYGETAYDRSGNLLTGTIRPSTGEQGAVANIDITTDTTHSTYGNITTNGNYKIALTPGLSRYVDSTAVWPTYINVNVGNDIGIHLQWEASSLLSVDLSSGRDGIAFTYSMTRSYDSILCVIGYSQYAFARVTCTPAYWEDTTSYGQATNYDPGPYYYFTDNPDGDSSRHDNYGYCIPDPSYDWKSGGSIIHMLAMQPPDGSSISTQRMKVEVLGMYIEE